MVRPLAVLVVVCSIGACGSAAELEQAPAQARAIRYLGRFDAHDSSLRRCSWPGSQIEARFSGSFVRVVLTDTAFDRKRPEHDRIAVVVDDRPPRTFALAEGRHVYPLAKDLGPGVHRVSIWKQTESAVGTLGFAGLQLQAGHGLLPLPRPPARHIELVGDSITTGYGNEGGDGSCHGNATNQNSYLSYGAIAARLLNTSCTMIAWSGKGVTRNHLARDRTPLPGVYDRVLATDPGAETAPPVPAPDVVVVNLGTNDFVAGTPDGAQIRRAYLAFLAHLRARYPRALLLLALGPMLADDYPQPRSRSLMRSWLQRIAADFRARSDPRIAFIELWVRPGEGVGCDAHPSLRTHARLGRELAAFLVKRLGWHTPR